MGRKAVDDGESFGNDSFLDVITNLVGILILLVMCVGIRIKHAPALDLLQGIPGESHEATADAPPVVSASREELQEAERIEASVMQMAQQMDTLAQERDERHQERSVLAYTVAQLKHDLDDQRGQQSGETQREFQIRSELGAAQAELAAIESELTRLKNAPTETVKIESLPTPLSKMVDGHEAHFQLRNGRVTAIPLEELLDLFQTEAKRQIWKLKEVPEVVSTVGPLGGFRLRYALDRVDVPADPRTGTPAGSMARLNEWTLIPSSGQLGETLTAALEPNSEFRKACRAIDPQRTTVTIWVYPDSFAEFRRLKRELFEQGYQIAGRPLPEGMPIGGSPQGTRSAAQ